MKTEEELWGLLREAYHMPYGSGQIALTEQIMQHADAGGFDELRIAARLHATTAYVHGGETAKAFVTFSWCRAEYDAHPDRFDSSDEHLLLWQFKYMVAGLMKFPTVPLARTYDVLDDMERRFRLSGYSLHTVYSYRHSVAEHLGDPAADEWFDRWNAAPRDQNSDCIGCDPTSKVYHLLNRDLDEEAIELAQPVLAGQLTCAEQPQGILTGLLLPYLRTGRLEEAADAHRRAYRAHRANLADLQDIAEHIVFCARTGNEVRGLEIVQRHLPWLEKAPHPQAEMWFAASAALLLGRLDAGVTVGATTAGALTDRLAARARDLAGRFDERNGTPAVGRRIEAVLTAAPLVEHLPLSAVARRQADAATPGLATPPRRTAEPLPDDPAELLDRAVALFEEHRISAARAAWEHFDELHPEPAPALAARRLDGAGRLATAEHRDEDAARLFREAAAAHRAAGSEFDALVSDARAAAAEHKFDELEAVTERILAAGDADARAEAHVRMEYPLLNADRVDEALAAIDAALAEEPTRPGLRADLAGRRARTLLVLERFEEAVASAADAREQFAALGDPPPAALAALIQGHALANLERFDEAVAAFDAALAAAVEREPRLSALVGRGRARLASDRFDAAVDDLVEAIADHIAHGEDPPAAVLRFDLAQAYYRAGQLLDAAEAAESALEVLDRIEAQEIADNVRYLLSRVYRDLDQPDQALALLETLAGNLDGFDNLPSRGRMLQEAAQLLYGIDRDAQAAERFAAAAEAFRAAGVVTAELFNRRMRALALRWAGDAPGSLAALAEVDTLLATVTAEASAGPGLEEPWLVWERAMIGTDAARVHVGAGQLDEALARVRGSGDAFRGIGALGEALDADFLHAEVLMRAGDPAAAEPLLRSVLGTAPTGSQLGQNSAWMLAESLEMQGRLDDAARVRAEHLEEQSDGE
ncbi:hypothetical protein KZZ52_00140 [Dactylosporangium sp. AC04546]|uniref:hypothetical protein n=1 Tax=Dactylosporangium sp. AC04546 TaxID=2862460 RepID=UPI001EE1425D|nr:hypothetical protein [Dactylosporangium sp. AC04546]WVK83906.1 hypothetical protein KZZ52_00140 [Dactylosporangium sp. AC04546]